MIKLSRKIESRRNRLNKLRCNSDKEIIKNFVDDFLLPMIATDNKTSDKANSIIISLSKKARKMINS